MMLYTWVRYVHYATTSLKPDGICAGAPWILFWENSGSFCQLSPYWGSFFLTVGWSSADIVRKCQTSCSSHWCLPSVPSSADCCDGQCACLGVANFVIIVIFWVFGILLCQLTLTTITYPFHLFINWQNSVNTGNSTRTANIKTLTKH